MPYSPTSRWIGWAPFLQAVLRIAAGVFFIVPGTMKLFAYPMGIPPTGGTAPLFSQIWIGGLLELAGGVLATVGLFTRPTAFVLSGMMAVAYFQFHAPQGFWPATNGGMAAALYCFVWLFFSAAGAGPWSLDALLAARRAGRDEDAA